MLEESATRGGFTLDTRTIIQTIKYYTIIGIGLGFLAIIILFQLAGDSGGGIVGGTLLIVIPRVVWSFAVLSGPIIAAFIVLATAGNALGDIKTRMINSGIANGIGIAVLGIIMLATVFIGLDVISGGSSTASGSGSSSIAIGKLMTIIILMIITNSIVGAGITLFKI